MPTLRAFLFDTYGTVCDFYGPLRQALSAWLAGRGIAADAGRLAIAWRNDYVRTTAAQAFGHAPFRPLRAILEETLARQIADITGARATAAEGAALCDTWRALEPWPDVHAGLLALKSQAIIAPLSNGNFADMVALARHARLPWDIILGASVARQYKPHPAVYLAAVEALELAPAEVCMVAAHQFDLHEASRHGLCTAFVRRRDEFGGPVRPHPVPSGLDVSAMAEMHVEGAWTFVADDFIDLARQVRAR